MSAPGDDGFEKTIESVAKKFFTLDPFDKERELFSTLTALKPERSWLDRLRDSFFQLIFLQRFTNKEGRELWASRLLCWQRHLDAYFQIADKKGSADQIANEKKADGQTADEQGTDGQTSDEQGTEGSAAGTESTATISSYS